MGLQATVQKYCTVMPILVWRKRTNSPSGKPQYEVNPSELTCRWDEKRMEIISTDGRKITSNAMIMSPSNIPVGSWVFQGTLAQWKAMTTYPLVPTPLQGGYEVVASGHHPDFTGAELLHMMFV